MHPNQVLEELGYTSAKSGDAWITEDKADEFNLPLWRVLEKETTVDVCGAYVFRTSSISSEKEPLLPSRPAVHVVRAQTEQEARKVHQKLWNLGAAPFLIIILPQRVKVYRGFDFNSDPQSRDTPIAESALNAAEIARTLQDFYAHEIDSGRIWQTQSKNVTPEKRVDQRLLKSLKELSDALISKGIERKLAHCLIGKYIYIYYLVEREILTDAWLAQYGLKLSNITGDQTSSQALQTLIMVLEQRFNGQVFPLNIQELGVKADEFIHFVAAVFRGDQVSGQLVLPDFKIYDFSCIPIEMLSSIYEQFLHSEGQAKHAGAVYTREFVADYLLCELNSVKPLEKGMKILDPSCGSGVFLVLSYRRLIEIEIRKNKGKKLTLQKLSRLLQENIYGVELIEQACYITEFSLLLTLLSYVEAPDLHENKDFRFPCLHNRNIFYADFFDDQASIWKNDLKFDWIIGNPPWTELNKNQLKQDQPHFWDWLNKNVNRYPVGQYCLSEAFSWRVTEALAENGCVALLIKATSLFNQTSFKYRQVFFNQNQVRRITNFSNLAYVLFAGRAKTRAATLIYSKAKSEQIKSPIIHFGPFVINQTLNRSTDQKRIWALTFYEDEIKTIDPSLAESGDFFIWKQALWGNSRDEQALTRFKRIFTTTLGDLITTRQWKLSQGRSVVSEQNKTYQNVLIGEMPTYQLLNAKLMPKRICLTVPGLAIETLDNKQAFYYNGVVSGLDIALAPHIYLTPAYAAYSDQDFLFPGAQIGLSAPVKDSDYLRSLSLYLNSNIGKYLLFFNCKGWGIDRNRFSSEEITSIPVPDLTAKQIDELAQLHRKLSVSDSDRDLFNKTNNVTLIQKIDEGISDILKIPSHLMLIAQEFIQLRYQLNEGKTRVSGTQVPSEQNLMDYAMYLRNSLDSFSHKHHHINIKQYPEFIACTVEITDALEPLATYTQKLPNLSNEDQNLWRILKKSFSQWAYVQQGLRILDGKYYHIWKTPRLIDWTCTQAMIDADEIIAEILNYSGAFV
ncbi:MAG: class I SAM-dependent DNA methyltransferase [Candidatus Sericytochromatia bacterium]